MTRHLYDVELDDTWLSYFTEILGRSGTALEVEILDRHYWLQEVVGPKNFLYVLTWVA